MMMMFDTHAHYQDEAYDEDRDILLSSLPSRGICGVVNVGYDLPSSEEAIRLCERYPFMYAAVGMHPHDSREMDDGMLLRFEEMTRHPKVVAIGEIGLDYHYDNSPREIQKKWFREQLRLAKKLDLPVIIHDREAHGDLLSVLQEEKAERGILHAFSGSVEMAEVLLKMGFYIAIGGAVTFKNARRTVEVAAMLPQDRLLLETDCPYLTPVPFRGKRNDSGLMRYTAEKIAEIRGQSAEEIMKITARNAERLFQIRL